MKSLQPYNKFLIALVGFGLTVLAPHFGAQQTFQYITGAITVLGVLHVPNGEFEDVVDDIEQGVDAAKTLDTDKPATQPSIVPPANPSV